MDRLASLALAQPTVLRRAFDAAAFLANASQGRRMVQLEPTQFVDKPTISG
jgi:hypothetical protein